jgi:hypothetical protein
MTGPILFTLAFLALFAPAHLHVYDKNVKVSIDWITLQWNNTLPENHCVLRDQCHFVMQACIMCNDSSFPTCRHGSCKSGMTSQIVTLKDLNEHGLVDPNGIISHVWPDMSFEIAYTQDKYTFELFVAIEDKKALHMIELFEATADFGPIHTLPASIFYVQGSEIRNGSKSGSFKVSLLMKCNTNFYGPTCQTFCDTNAQEYVCQYDGKRQCRPNYFPAEDDLYFCIEAPDACSQKCTEISPGDDHCDGCGKMKCKPGFELSANGNHCKLSACNPPCKNNGTCSGKICDCPSDFTGRSCETQIPKTSAPVTQTTRQTTTSASQPSSTTRKASTTTKATTKKRTTPSRKTNPTKIPKITTAGTTVPSTISTQSTTSKEPTTTSNPTPKPEPVVDPPPSPPPSKTKKSLGGGVIAAIIIVVAGVVVVAGYIGIRAYRNSKRRNASPSISEPLVRASSLTVENPIYEFNNASNEADNHL